MSVAEQRCRSSPPVPLYFVYVTTLWQVLQAAKGLMTPSTNTTENLDHTSEM